MSHVNMHGEVTARSVLHGHVFETVRCFANRGKEYEVHFADGKAVGVKNICGPGRRHERHLWPRYPDKAPPGPSVQCAIRSAQKVLAPHWKAVSSIDTQMRELAAQRRALLEG